MSDGVVELAVAAVGGAASVEVEGVGPLAAAVRARLADVGPATAGPPAAIIEASGDPAAIRAALAQVADLGTVVLAGPVPASGIDLDLYADVHVRGLTVVGVPPTAHPEEA
jgi:threonine dehydrogenase-like Zn-dependent dehydrogenase